VQYYDQPDGRGPLPSCPILAGERRLSQANAGPSVLAMGRPMGYGAFEMAARYSTINLNDRFTPPASCPRPGATRLAAANRRSTPSG
jgi:hypothetical protein